MFSNLNEPPERTMSPRERDMLVLCSNELGCGLGADEADFTIGARNLVEILDFILI